jgi:Cu+-exporting ATPase
LAIALLTGIYWSIYDTAKIWPAVTAIFIIACPCALLLSNTFTNGNILRILGRNHFYLRNAQIIEDIATIDHIVFDKTGTLTSAHQQEVSYEGTPLTGRQTEQVAAMAACSSHPLSKMLCKHFDYKHRNELVAFSVQVKAWLLQICDGRNRPANGYNRVCKL